MKTASFLFPLFMSVSAFALESREMTVLDQANLRGNIFEYQYTATGNMQIHTPVVSVDASIIQITSGGEVAVEVNVRVKDTTPEKALNRMMVPVTGSANISELTKTALQANFPNLKADYVWISKVNLPSLTVKESFELQ